MSRVQTAVFIPKGGTVRWELDWIDVDQDYRLNLRDGNAVVFSMVLTSGQLTQLAELVAPEAVSPRAYRRRRELVTCSTVGSPLASARALVPTVWAIRGHPAGRLVARRWPGRRRRVRMPRR